MVFYSNEKLIDPALKAKLFNPYSPSLTLEEYGLK